MYSLLIPSSIQKSLKSLEVYSPPLSDLSTLIFLSIRFSTWALNSWNLTRTPSWSLRSKSTSSESDHRWRAHSTNIRSRKQRSWVHTHLNVSSPRSPWIYCHYSRRTPWHSFQEHNLCKHHHAKHVSLEGLLPSSPEREGLYNGYEQVSYAIARSRW